ncbi:MAG: ATP-binding protein [Gammaproteobacteria bacterium]|nr:ATP-binding protein [Gammaproteobacteria bacterium]
MKRDSYQQLLTWKQSSTRKTLILKGARQVGKTYILKQFAAREYSNSIYVNFEKQPDIFNIFAGNLDPAEIIENLAIVFAQSIEPGKTLLIFDEIQACPNALNSMKYFNEEANQYHLVAAGSLLGVKLNNTKGFPVGKVDFINLFPLTFFEFLDAIDRGQLRQRLEQLSKPEPINETLHNLAIKLLKTYFFVGGMPEAVQAYIDGRFLEDVRNIQHAILDAYVADFAKHAEAQQIMKIMDVWELIPQQLAKENKKFIFSAINKSARAREYATAIQWLVGAGLIYKAFNVTTPKIPLEVYCNKKAFKTFMLDVGLLGAMTNLSIKIMAQDEQLFNEFQGAFTENFVAQELTANKLTELYYWTDSTSEIDFVFSHDMDLLPLEVKVGTAVKKKKSLKQYSLHYNPKRLLRTSLKNLRRDDNLINIPLYMLKQLKVLV